MAASQDAISAAFAASPAPEGVKYAYGTAGFRMKAELLNAACVRTGALAAVRALEKGMVRLPQPANRRADVH